MRLNSLIAVLWIAIVFWHLSKIEGIVVNDNICLKKMAAQKSYRCATLISEKKGRHKIYSTLSTLLIKVIILVFIFVNAKWFNDLLILLVLRVESETNIVRAGLKQPSQTR